MSHDSRCHRAVCDQCPLQSLVRLPACAAGRRLMNTFADPPTTMPPQPVLPPAMAAGRPLMKTSCEPSTTGVPLAVPSPTRAAGLFAITASGLPSEMPKRMVDLMAHLLVGVAAIIIDIPWLQINARRLIPLDQHYLRNVLTSETLPS